MIPAVNARFIEPMLCLAVSKLPGGTEWQLELKLDGYRGIGIKTNGRAHLTSRNGKNFSERFPTVTRALNRLPDENGHRRRDCRRERRWLAVVQPASELRRHTHDPVLR